MDFSNLIQINSKLKLGENILLRTNNSVDDNKFEWFVNLTVDTPTENNPHHITSLYRGYGNDPDILLGEALKSLEA